LKTTKETSAEYLLPKKPVTHEFVRPEKSLMKSYVFAGMMMNNALCLVLSASSMLAFFYRRSVWNLLGSLSRESKRDWRCMLRHV